MDPNETLRQLAESLNRLDDSAESEEVATLFESLDDWLSKGESLPDRWAKGR